MARSLRTQLEWLRDNGVSTLRWQPVAHAPIAHPASTVRAEPSGVESREPVASVSSNVVRPATDLSRPSFLQRAAKLPSNQVTTATPPRVSAPVITPPMAIPTPLPMTPSATPAEMLGRALREEPPLQGVEKLGALAVMQQAVTECTRCRLATSRKLTVFARGNPDARVAFVGEGPGRDEDLQGLPFVGAAGELLDKIIAAMGLGNDEIYVCNVVKCRPPGNRVPLPDEMAACGPFLMRQLGLARPEMIVALGKTSANFLLGVEATMSSIRGKWQTLEGIAVMPTWHPSYLLRTPDAKKDTWADMKLVMERLGRPVGSARR